MGKCFCETGSNSINDFLVSRANLAPNHTRSFDELVEKGAGLYTL